MAEREVFVGREALSDGRLTRSAFDLARHLGRSEAIARLDALMRNGVYSVEDVHVLAKRYPRVRG